MIRLNHDRINNPLTPTLQVRGVYLSFPSQTRKLDSPTDEILFEMFIEADAQAIDRKAGYRLRNKTGVAHMPDAEYVEFASYLQMTANSDYTPSERIQRATQQSFITFLEREFSEPVYLKRHIICAFSGNDARCFLFGRPVSESHYLTDEFLARLSQVTSTTHYLDKDGMAQIRRLIQEKLPAAIAKFVPNLASGAPRYGAG